MRAGAAAHAARERAGVGVSSDSGSMASCSALLNARCALSRRKNRTKVATRQRLIVRVSGMTAMAVEESGEVVRWMPARTGTRELFLRD